MTRLFRNADGILAVERDGVLVYGPNKVYRAVDVTIENLPSEHWVALPLMEWRGFNDVTNLLISTAARIEPLINGKAAVFAMPATQTEASIRSVLQAFIPSKTAAELAWDRLLAWKAGTMQVRRDEIVDILTMLGIYDGS